MWYSTTSLVGAQRWHDEIGEALARCDWFVIVLSRASERSEWVKRELQYALINTDRYADRIVPIRKGACNTERLSWVLDSLQYVDFRQAFDDGCRALLRIWGIGFVPNTAAARSRRKRRSRPHNRRRRG